MAFVRHYKPTDFDATAKVCRKTLAPSLTSSEPAWRLGPYIWTHQYTFLSPSTCFVLDDGTGLAVGYCIGCPDIPIFINNYDKYVNEVLEPSDEIQRPAKLSGEREPWTLPDGTINETSMSQTAHNPKWLLLDGNNDVLGEGYKATMHINLLESWQGEGWGRQLIARFTESVKAEKQKDTKGIYIGIATDNSEVVKFYERVGFRLWHGGDGSGIRMVKDV